MRYLTMALTGLTTGLLAAFAVSYLDPRTPWWGHAIFGLPAALTALGAGLAARRFLTS